MTISHTDLPNISLFFCLILGLFPQFCCYVNGERRGTQGFIIDITLKLCFQKISILKVKYSKVSIFLLCEKDPKLSRKICEILNKLCVKKP